MTTQAPLPTLLQLTPLDPAYREDPQAVLHDLRARCPVHRDALSASVVLSRYDDVRSVVTDLTLWRDPINAEEGAAFQRAMAAQDPDRPRTSTISILHLDDPDHARVREPLAKAFYARVARFRPEAERIIDRYLDALEGQATFDLMAGFCVPVPVDAIAAILGVEHERLDDFRAWSEGVILGLNPFKTAEQTERMTLAGAALNAYFTKAMDDRRGAPRDDLISDMVRLQAEGAPLSDDELRINLTALLVGGNLTTTDLIGNGVRLFLTHPDQLARLRAEPSRVNAAVEEILRVDGPVDITGRIIPRDTEIGGCPVTARQSVTASLRAANHDPSAYDNPDRFDIDRKRKPHVAFGGGAHICIGAPLARLEAQIALLKLFERFPTLRLAEPGAPADWRRLPFFRGLETLVLAP